MSQDNSDPIVDIAKNGQIEHLFTTPVFSYVLKDAQDLNSRLRELILEQERVIPSNNKSNKGGWQSLPDFFDWDDRTVTILRNYISNVIRVATASVCSTSNLDQKFELYGWAAVNRRGHYNTTHIHPMSTWSGVYYVDLGDASPNDPAALLEFTHPVTASVMTFFPGILPSARAVNPATGMIILFPSYLLHSVHMYYGERPRICVAFNAHMHI